MTTKEAAPKGSKVAGEGVRLRRIFSFPKSRSEDRPSFLGKGGEFEGGGVQIERKTTTEERSDQNRAKGEKRQ